MPAGILPSIIYPDTVRKAQKRLLEAATGTDQGVQQCAALDNGTRASWGDFYSGLVDFTREEPGIFGLGTMQDRADAYGTELYAWQQKLQTAMNAAGCVVTVPNYNPDKSPGTDALVTLAQYAFYGALVVGGAYVVGKVVETARIFAPRQRA